MLAVRSWSFQPLIKFAIGGLFAIVPQAVWILLHLDDLHHFAVRYFVTSSISVDRFDALSSLLNEFGRYKDYWSSLSLVDRLLQVVLFVVLPLLSLFYFGSFERALLIVIIAAPGITLALLSQGKNFYYLVSVLPAWSIVAAAGAGRLPRMLVYSGAGVLLIGSMVREIPAAIASRQEVQAAAIVNELSTELPVGAVVFSPLGYAGLVRLRPDLRFFSPHALSTSAEKWVYPGCTDFKRRLKQIITDDNRVTSRDAGLPLPDSVSIVSVSEWPLFNYLHQIFVTIDKNEVDCLAKLNGSEVVQTRLCGPKESDCISLIRTVIRLD
jgi:hypothetical protein